MDKVYEELLKMKKLNYFQVIIMIFCGIRGLKKMSMYIKS